MKLPKEFKEKWLAALRSGEYKQGSGLLLDSSNNYCCLGVACIVAGYHTDQIVGKCYAERTFEELPEILRGASYDSNIVKTLANMNDGESERSTPLPKKSFSEIADYIEANL